MQIKYERREPVVCDVCKHVMEFSGEIMASPDGGDIYVKYVCPRRDNEKGCGAFKLILFKKSQKPRK